MNFNTLRAKHNSKWDINFLDYTELNNTINADGFDVYRELIPAIAKFYHVDDSVIYSLAPSDADALLSNLFALAKKPSNLQSRIVINGKEYGFIPNFKDEVTMGELIDLDFYLSQQNIPMVLSILYRPIKKYQFNPFGILGPKRFDIIDYRQVKWEPHQSWLGSIKHKASNLSITLTNLFRSKSNKKPHQPIQSTPSLYEIVEYDKTNEELFKHVNLEIADGALSFFLMCYES